MSNVLARSLREPGSSPPGPTPTGSAGEAATIPRAAPLDECWINVYPRRYGGHLFGCPCSSAEEATEASYRVFQHGLLPAVYRLHVQFKQPYERITAAQMIQRLKGRP